MANLALDWKGCPIMAPITIAITMLSSPLRETTIDLNSISGTLPISTAPTQSIGTAEFQSPGLKGMLERLALKAMRQEITNV